MSERYFIGPPPAGRPGKESHLGYESGWIL